VDDAPQSRRKTSKGGGGLPELETNEVSTKESPLRGSLKLDLN